MYILVLLLHTSIYMYIVFAFQRVFRSLLMYIVRLSYENSSDTFATDITIASFVIADFNLKR